MKISESFTEVLREMNHPLAKAVLKRAHIENEYTSWARLKDIIPISIGYTFQYFYPSTVARYAKRLRRYAPPKSIGNYFSFREKAGLISFCPVGRDQIISSDGRWARAGRQEMKPGKWIKAVLSPRLIKKLGGDKAVASFAARFSAYEAGEAFEIREVECFRDIYRPSFFGYSDRYEVAHGVADSCMWGKDVGQFYKRLEAPKPYVIYKNDRPVGRFIFWPELIGPDGQKISLADRIYAKPSATEAVFRWAEENGHYRKSAQAMNCEYVISPTGETLHLRGFRATVSPIMPRDYFCPYIDTLKYGEYDDDGDLVALHATRLGNDVYEFCCTDGSVEGGPDEHEGQVQDVDGEWIDLDEAVEVDGDYYHQDDERIVYCDHGSHEGETILRADAYLIEVGGRIGTIYIHEDDVNRA